MRSRGIRRKNARRLRQTLERLKDHFTVTRGERRALTLVFLLLLALILSRYGIRAWYQAPPLILGELEYELLEEVSVYGAAARHSRTSPRSYPGTGSQVVSLHPFPFDPNAVTAAILDSLGLPPRVSRNWLAYLAGGGHFREASDIGRIYGMMPEWVQELAGMVEMDERVETLPRGRIELNTADSVALISLPGIGPVFAKRIMAYRNRLGGFMTTGQLLAVYGMDSLRYESVMPYLDLDTSHVIRLDLQYATFTSLKRHPLIGYEMAYEISEFRKIYGAIDSLGQLRTFHRLSAGERECLRQYFRE